MPTKSRAPIGPATLLLAASLLALSGCSSAPTTSSDPVQGFIERVAATFTPDTPAEVARDAFDVYDPDTRRQAVSRLSAAHFGGQPPYVRMYRLLADDPDPTVRAVAAKALGTHGSAEDVPRLAGLLSDRSELVRWQAALALQRVHDGRAVAPLLDALSKDTHADTRQAAALALGQYAEPRVFQGLVAGLDDLDYSVAHAARQSLATLTGYDYGPDASLWLIWSRKPGTDLFAHRKLYTYQPYAVGQNWVERTFWSPEPETAAPRTPTGMNAPSPTDAP